MSLVEFNIYNGIKNYITDDTYELSFRENKLVFESSDFCFNVDADDGYLRVDKKTWELMSKFYASEFLEGGFVCLIEGEKDEFGNVYVSSFIETIKVNGLEVFNINDYKIYLNYYEDYDFVEPFFSLKNELSLDIKFQKWD